MRKKYRSYKALAIIVAVLTMTIINLNISSAQMAPTILRYAELQTRKLATLIINKAVSRHVLENLDQETMVNISKNQDGSIGAITFNTLELNRLLTATTNILQLNLKSVEQGLIDKVEYSDLGITVPDHLLKRGILYEIPFGIASDNVLLASIGPKIPVRFQLVGDVMSAVSSHVKEYGINNVLIELNITFSVTQQVVIPLASSVVQVTNDFPVALQVIQGKIPDFYLGSQTIAGDTVSFYFEEGEAY